METKMILSKTFKTVSKAKDNVPSGVRAYDEYLVSQNTCGKRFSKNKHMSMIIYEVLYK